MSQSFQMGFFQNILRAFCHKTVNKWLFPWVKHLLTNAHYQHHNPYRVLIKVWDQQYFFDQQ